ncbi:MAG: methionyl-tRNA formyltransferase [Patescibacteria group bacterium]
MAKGVRPKAVICNLDDDGQDKGWHESLAKIAQEAGLHTILGKKVRDTEIVQFIREQQPDIIFCIGGMQIIPSEVLILPRLGCLNIHPALLPKYRGRYSTAHALFNGETSTGVTVHWMDAGLDSGPIIAQREYPIEDSDTGKSLYDKFTNVGSEMYVEFVDKWLAGLEIESTPQDESRATYYPKGLPNNGEIDWSWDGTKIRNFIRAMTFEPFPPASFILGEKRMVIIDEKYFSGFEDKK